jgi:hypothetical protein
MKPGKRSHLQKSAICSDAISVAAQLSRTKSNAAAAEKTIGCGSS